MVSFPSRTTLEKDSLYWADQYNILTSDPNDPHGRGNGDARDAFRHAYATAVYKNLLLQIFQNNALATRAAYALGVAVELGSLHNYNTSEFGDYNQDLYNDAQAASYDPTQDGTPQEFAQKLLQHGDLIESSDVRKQGGKVAPFDISNLISSLTQLKDALKNLADAASQDLENTVAGALDYLDRQFGTPHNSTPVSGPLGGMAGAFGRALAMLTPIALDLNGDGIKYTTLANSKVHFDIDNDKFAEHVEWVSPQDGFLVRDLNGNGQIDNVGEMFGETGGTTAYQKLAALDTNKNGKIDAGDTAFASLRVWQDSNSDGLVETGELKTLAQWGIASLSLEQSTATTLAEGMLS